MKITCSMWRIISFVIITSVTSILGIELVSFRPRLRCFKDIQLTCNEEFVDAYPDLSMSYSNITKAETWFLLYTRKNKDQPELLHKCGGRLPPRSKFNPKNRLILIIMPFNVGYCDFSGFREMTEQFLINGEYNIVIADWTWGSYIDYAQTLLNAKITANQIVVVLKNIQKQTGISFKNVYIVGFSLGGQIAGMIGSYIKVGRITGLDVAAPGFAEEETPLQDRLDPSDADFVDVWHTSAGRCLPSPGLYYDAGHADFYVNGGSKQPACPKYALHTILKGDWWVGFAAIFSVVCNHYMSIEYFKTSINPQNCQYVAVRCENKSPGPNECNDCGENGENCTIMGLDSEKYLNTTHPPRGRFIVRTGGDCPYCDNSNLVKQPSFI